MNVGNRRSGTVAGALAVLLVAAEGYLFLARGLLQEGAPIPDVQALVEKGLSLARAPDLKALGWLLLADVFDRKGQPEQMNEALKKADRYMSARSGSGRRP